MPHDADAVARRSLTGDCQIVGARHRAVQHDVTANVEDDNATAVADGVAKRTGAAVGKCGDVIDRARPSPRSVLAESLRAREGWKLGANHQARRDYPGCKGSMDAQSATFASGHMK